MQKALTILKNLSIIFIGGPLIIGGTLWLLSISTSLLNEHTLLFVLQTLTTMEFIGVVSLFLYTPLAVLYNSESKPLSEKFKHIAVPSIATSVIFLLLINLSGFILPSFYNNQTGEFINALFLIVCFIALESVIFAGIATKFKAQTILKPSFVIVLCIFLSIISFFAYVERENLSKTFVRCSPGEVYAQPLCGCKRQCITKEKANANFRCAIGCPPYQVYDSETILSNDYDFK